ncbi:MAG: rhomboid family intramembrane serine protease [Polyangiaceae bacterium]|nr:rhomboid family intramembrane serine protease [Polyangiaceae bacterium]
MLPLGDDNPTFRRPIVTPILIGLNVLVWILFQGAGTEEALVRSTCELGAIPGELTGKATEDAIQLGPNVVCLLADQPHWYTIVTSMFLHGGWLHLIGNMWFLWIFGDNVEDSMGRLRFLVFYLLSGVAAAVTHIFTDPASVLPMVGASGAIGGVMGAYVVLYPKAPVRLLLILGILITTVRVPAVVMLGYWFLLQVVSGLPQLSAGEPGGVAFWAHVGGFLTGVALCFVFRNPALVERHRAALAALRQSQEWERVRAASPWQHGGRHIPWERRG